MPGECRGEAQPKERAAHSPLRQLRPHEQSPHRAPDPPSDDRCACGTQTPLPCYTAPGQLALRSGDRAVQKFPLRSPKAGIGWSWQDKGQRHLVGALSRAWQGGGSVGLEGRELSVLCTSKHHPSPARQSFKDCSVCAATSGLMLVLNTPLGQTGK